MLKLRIFVVFSKMYRAKSKLRHFMKLFSNKKGCMCFCVRLALRSSRDTHYPLNTCQQVPAHMYIKAMPTTFNLRNLHITEKKRIIQNLTI